MTVPLRAEDLDTPAVYVDLDVLERNISQMQSRCREWGVGLRPHTKTHKTPEIARMQLDAGAVGITVAKLGEAEVLPGDDVLVAYPLMPGKRARLQALARSRRVTAVADSIATAAALPDVELLVELDVGQNRCGVQTPDHFVAVAKACTRFRGILYWPAWLDEEGFRRASNLIEKTIAALRAAGLTPEVVSGGSTPGAGKTPLVPDTTEIRPGTYVFNDASAVSGGVARVEDCALRVLTTVVSTAVPGQCILDGGSKTFSSDPTHGAPGYGRFVDRPWTMTKMNEEHGYVATGEAKAELGERVWVIPSHVCSTVNMHDELHYGRAGEVHGSWRVAARGKVR
jgi:D-serine deaminase-like pyridoxal phosphate-dependent protein